MESYRCSPGQEEEIAAVPQAYWRGPRGPRPGEDTMCPGGDRLRGEALGHPKIPRWPFPPLQMSGAFHRCRLRGCSGVGGKQPAEEGP